MLIRLTPNTPICSVACDGAADFPQDAGRVPGPIRRRGGLSRLPGGVAVARWLSVPALWARARVRASASPSLAVQGLRPPDLSDGRIGAALHAHPAARVVLGGVPGHHAHAGGVGT